MVLVLTCLLGGCHEWTETPEGFVEVDSKGVDYKAVTPEGAVIVIRHRDNDEEGDLDFWSEVFELEMVKAKGYKVVDKGEVSSADGTVGSVLLFEYAQGQTPYHYGLTVFVRDDLIVTVETATELDNYERREEAFEHARENTNMPQIIHPLHL